MSTYRSHYQTAPRRQVRPGFIALALLAALAATIWSLL